MRLDDRTRLSHLVEMLQLALTKLVEIVGEAAKYVTAETQAMHPTVPWTAAARMRDRLVQADGDRETVVASACSIQ